MQPCFIDRYYKPAYIINHFLDFLSANAQQGGEAVGDRFGEPDVRHWTSQTDVAKPISSYAIARDFDTATLADNTLVLFFLVLAASAFVILDRAKDALTKEPVFSRLVGPVVESVRCFNFAVAL